MLCIVFFVSWTMFASLYHYAINTCLARSMLFVILAFSQISIIKFEEIKSITDIDKKCMIPIVISQHNTRLSHHPQSYNNLTLFANAFTRALPALHSAHIYCTFIAPDIRGKWIFLADTSLTSWNQPVNSQLIWHLGELTHSTNNWHVSLVWHMSII